MQRGIELRQLSTARQMGDEIAAADLVAQPLPRLREAGSPNR
jgi:hypothetical protein